MNYEINAEALRERLAALEQGQWRTSVRMVDTSLICPNPYHAPKTVTPSELATVANAIKAEGFSSPFTVRWIGNERKPLYELLSGENRFRACLYGEISPVPCVIVNVDPDNLQDIPKIPLPRNLFEEADLIFELFSGGEIRKEDLAKALGISPQELENKLILHNFDQTERKILLKGQISRVAAVQLYSLDPRTKYEVYLAILNGVQGQVAEDLIRNLAFSGNQTRIHIRDTRLFFNTVEKAVATMNRSGIPVKVIKEEKKTFTRMILTVPRRM